MTLTLELLQLLQAEHANSDKAGQGLLVQSIGQIAALHDALLNRKRRAVKRHALRLAAIALAIHEHGDDHYCVQAAPRELSLPEKEKES